MKGDKKGTMKKIVILIVLFFLLLLQSGCSEEENVAVICEEKIFYGQQMRFVFYIPNEEEDFFAYLFDQPWLSVTRVWELTHPNSPYFTSYFTELVFVHSEAEATEFPDNVIVAWPSTVTEHMPEAIERMIIVENDIGVLANNIYLTDFDLVAPLSLTDLVDNWEQANRLWQSLTSSGRSTAHDIAAREAQGVNKE